MVYSQTVIFIIQYKHCRENNLLTEIDVHFYLFGTRIDVHYLCQVHYSYLIDLYYYYVATFLETNATFSVSYLVRVSNLHASLRGRIY